MARQSTFTQEAAEEICSRLSSGEPLAQICRDDRMPGVQTVYDWRDANPDFAVAIARAREAGFDQIAMDALYIADDNGQDTRYIKTEHGEREVADTEWISRSKLRVETRLKLLAKWDPKRYGERMDLTSGGEKITPDVTDAAAKAAALLAAARDRRDADKG